MAKQSGNTSHYGSGVGSGSNRQPAHAWEHATLQ